MRTRGGGGGVKNLRFCAYVPGADLGKKLRGDLYAGIYSKIGSI